MPTIDTYEPHFAATLPDTWQLLRAAGLVLHPRVCKVRLMGSRGLAGGARPDSDIDLSLLVDIDGIPDRQALQSLLHDVLRTTLDAWQSPIEADLAAVYDVRGCGLRCFESAAPANVGCDDGIDCFGLYKIQKGFSGFVENAGVDVTRILPCITIWQAGPPGS